MKFKFFYLCFCTAFLCGCSISQNSSSENFLTRDSDYASELNSSVNDSSNSFLSDIEDAFSLIEIKSGYYFLNDNDITINISKMDVQNDNDYDYTELIGFARKINKSFNHYDELEASVKSSSLHFYSLIPDPAIAVDEPFSICQSYLFGYDVDNDINSNAVIFEQFDIYDESLGNLNKLYDLPGLTIGFKCIFYGVSDYADTLEAKVETIKGSYDGYKKITLFDDETIVGIIYANYGNLNLEEFLMNYLMNFVRKM